MRPYGTFAHPEIACEFSMWIDPAFRLDVVKKFRTNPSHSGYQFYFDV